MSRVLAGSAPGGCVAGAAVPGGLPVPRAPNPREARMTLVVAPWTVKQAQIFVSRVHRRLPRIQGAMWAIRAVGREGVVGCAMVGWPARALNEDTLAVLRVAVIEGHPNACSLLYGACARAARAMGALNMVTYTHGDERGTSLKAAGWVYDGMTDGGEHSRPSRPRLPGVDPLPKHRWWAPWSERVQKTRRP